MNFYFWFELCFALLLLLRCANYSFMVSSLTGFSLLFLAGLLRYKVDLESIQMMLDDDYYDNEDFDLEDY